MFLGVTGMLPDMPYTDEERRKLATAVRDARIRSRLDKEPASRAAEVSSITWKRVEDAQGVRDASLSKILSSLGLPAADVILSSQPGLSDLSPPDPLVVDSTVELSSGGLVYLLSLLWRSWRDLTMRLIGMGDSDLSRQARRSLIITADVVTDLAALAQPGPDLEALLGDVEHTVAELFSNRIKERKEHALETGTTADAQTKEPEIEEAQRPVGDYLPDHLKEPLRRVMKPRGGQQGSAVSGDEHGEQDQQLSGE